MAHWYTGETGTQHLTTSVDFSALAPVVYIRPPPPGAQRPEVGPIATSGVTATNVDFVWPATDETGIWEVEIRGSNSRQQRYTLTVA